MGIECVSVYAFAIDNFKRTQDEVDTLMGLASTKLEELCQQGLVTCNSVAVSAKFDVWPTGTYWTSTVSD
jgi:ditrans,polycis-polyprenyl diphosphate synthase